MSSYSSLLSALVGVLETSREQGGLVTKQSLLDSTNEFKERLSVAKQDATNLPGGDMSISDQEEVIGMLENLLTYKRAQLTKFAQLATYSKLDGVSTLTETAQCSIQINVGNYD